MSGVFSPLFHPTKKTCNWWGGGSSLILKQRQALKHKWFGKQVPRRRLAAVDQAGRWSSEGCEVRSLVVGNGPWMKNLLLTLLTTGCWLDTSRILPTFLVTAITLKSQGWNLQFVKDCIGGSGRSYLSISQDEDVSWKLWGTPPWNEANEFTPEKCPMVGRWICFWDGLFFRGYVGYDRVGPSRFPLKWQKDIGREDFFVCMHPRIVSFEM